MITNSLNTNTTTIAEGNKTNEKKIAKKIFCIGPKGSGKTSFINSWINNEFNPDCEPSTGTQVYRVSNYEITNKQKTFRRLFDLEIYDISTETDDSIISPAYLHRADGVFFLFSVQELTRLHIVQNWKESISKLFDANIVKIFILTKNDITQTGIYIDPSFVQTAIEDEGFFDKYFTTSSAINYRTNIVKAFDTMIRLIYEKEKIEIDLENKRKRDSRIAFSFKNQSLTTDSLNNEISNSSESAHSNNNNSIDKDRNLTHTKTNDQKPFNYIPLAVNAFVLGTKVIAPPEYIPTQTNIESNSNTTSTTLLENTKNDKNMHSNNLLQANRDALKKHFKPGYLQERKELLNNNEDNDPDKDINDNDKNNSLKEGDKNKKDKNKKSESLLGDREKLLSLESFDKKTNTKKSNKTSNSSSSSINIKTNNNKSITSLKEEEEEEFQYEQAETFIVGEESTNSYVKSKEEMNSNSKNEKSKSKKKKQTERILIDIAKESDSE